MIRAQFDLALPGFLLQASIDIPASGVTALFGPSGSGKTTLLRCLAGLEHAAGGFLQVDTQTWQDDSKKIFLPVHQRSLGFVFQEPSLFEHCSVRRNLEFGYRRTPVAQRKMPWQRTVDLLDVGPLLHRMPESLSGGERQRVAIARAVLAGPKLMLMDEPLAALDTVRKQEILPFLERLHRELSIPVLYVSHHIDEVARLADHLVLLRAGRVIASGPLMQMLARLDLPTAHDEDAGVVIETRVATRDQRYHLNELDFSGGQIHVARDSLTPGQPVRLRIQARDVSLALADHHDSSILNRFPATVVEIAAASNPANVMVLLDAGGTALLARITHRSLDQLHIGVGSRVWAQVKAVALME
ncbi:Molybdenum import ATP-binding protein ModC 1 [Burkholderiales bacterium]|nr:Molybdenum import ATP-binding protein ModC 1 [Burkholderiales bacterium]